MGAHPAVPSGELVFWHYRGCEAALPKVGDRVEFRRDPQETAEGTRLPLARGVRVVGP